MSQNKPSWKHTLAPPAITGLVTIVATLVAASLSVRNDAPGVNLLFPVATSTVTATVTATTAITATTTATETVTAPPGPSTAPVAGGQVSYMADLDPVEGGLLAEPRTILKKSYPRAISNQMGGCSQSGPAEWALGTGVNRFQAWVGLDDTSLISTARVQFSVTLDGKPLIARTLGLKQVQFIDVSVKDGLRLKLETVLVEGNVRNNCNTEAIAVWGDAAVTNL